MFNETFEFNFSYLEPLDYEQRVYQLSCREFNSLQVCCLRFFSISISYLVTGVGALRGVVAFSMLKLNSAPGVD